MKRYNINKNYMAKISITYITGGKNNKKEHKKQTNKGRKEKKS